MYLNISRAIEIRDRLQLFVDIVHSDLKPDGKMGTKDIIAELTELIDEIQGDADDEREAVMDLAVAGGDVRDGELEIDRGDATISYSDSNGAYVEAWLWVPFEGTDLDRDTDDDEDEEPTTVEQNHN